MTNPESIQAAVDVCANAYGKAYIPAQGTIASRYPGLRDNLEALAIYCGCTMTIAERASDGELISLYAVARKSPESAVRTASRIMTKYGFPQAPQAPQATPEDVGALEYVHARIDKLQRNTEKAHSDAVAAIVELQKNADLTSVEILAELDKVRTRLDAMGDSSREYVSELVEQALKAQQPTRVVVQVPSQPQVELGLVHYATPKLIRWIGAGLNVYLHGPAGTGKTTAGRQVAEAFGLPFYFAAKVESEYLLLGFKDANGQTVRTQFREAYENGGVFLFDEMDGSDPGAIVALNAALANGHCPFPDGVIARHPDFKCIGAGNTTLTGANHEYSGRNQLDAASIDRFAFIEFGMDEKLESALASNSVWCQHVQAIRAEVAKRGIAHLVTPRATYDGCKLLEIGELWEDVENGCIFKGLDADTVRALREAVQAANPFMQANAA